MKKKCTDEEEEMEYKGLPAITKENLKPILEEAINQYRSGNATPAKISRGKTTFDYQRVSEDRGILTTTLKGYGGKSVFQYRCNIFTQENEE